MGGLREQPGTGRPCHLSQQQLQDLPKVVEQLQQQQPKKRVTVRDIHKHLLQQGVECSEAAVYKWLPKAGLSWVTNRGRRSKSDAQARAKLKKEISGSAAGRDKQDKK